MQLSQINFDAEEGSRKSGFCSWGVKNIATDLRFYKPLLIDVSINNTIKRKAVSQRIRSFLVMYQ